MRKILIGVAAVLVAVLVLGVVLLFVDFDAPDLGQRILDRAAEGAGIEVRAAGFRFNLRRGLRLEQVVARTELPAGEVTTRVDRVVLEHRLLPFLFGEIEVDRLLLENPVIEVVTRERPAVATAPLPGAKENGAPGSLRGGGRIVRIALGQDAATSGSEAGSARPVTVHEIEIVNATVLVRDDTDGTFHTEIHSLDVSLRDLHIDPQAGSAVLGLTAHGELEVGEVRAGEISARGSAGTLAAERGVFSVGGVALTADEGRIAVEQLVVDLRVDPYTYEATLSADSLDLNALVDVPRDGGLGNARLDFDGEGWGTDMANLTGRGIVHLDAGSIPQHPALEQVDALLKTSIAGLAYEATDIEFTVADNRAEIAPFDLVTKVLRLTSEGEVGLTGDLALRVLVAVPGESVNLGFLEGNLSQQIVAALTDEAGWVSIPVLVEGTYEDPWVTPDMQALFAAAQENTDLNLGSWLQGQLQELLKRRRERQQ